LSEQVSVRESKPFSKAALRDLTRVLSPEDILTKPVDRRLYGYDAGTLWKRTPDLVLFPRSA
jgi:hypothetical protein